MKEKPRAGGKDPQKEPPPQTSLGSSVVCPLHPAPAEDVPCPWAGTAPCITAWQRPSRRSGAGSHQTVIPRSVSAFLLTTLPSS